jgi:uncharacterized membrane protein SirB2
MTLLVVVSSIAACWRSWPRVVLVVPALAATAMVLSSGWGAFKKTGVSYATQGRYLFAGIAGLAVLVSLGVARLSGRPRASQAGATLCVALALQAGSLWLVLRRYWAGSTVDRVRAMADFAPLPGPFTAGVLIVTGLAAGAALGVVFAVRAVPAEQ